MNDRIKELAKKAGLSELAMKWSDESLEVFAKLIIEECTDICYEQADDEANKCAWKIEKHFGM